MSRHDYDHAAAQAIYNSLKPPNRTYAEVSRRYGASETSIRKWAKAERWDEQLQAAIQRGVRKGLKSLEERTAQDARIRDLAADRVEELLTGGDAVAEWVRQVYADSDKRVRLNEGKATDHVEYATVQAGFRESQAAAIEKVGELVARGLAGAALAAAFRSEFPAELVQRLALIDGGGDGG